MAYRPDQLPFLGYVEKVREMKRKFDRDRGVYPLTVTVECDVALMKEQRHVLITEELDFVHSRVGITTRVVTDCMWEGPLLITLSGRDGSGFDEIIEKVRVDDLNQPMFTAEELKGTFLEVKKRLGVDWTQYQNIDGTVAKERLEDAANIQAKLHAN